MVVVWTMLGLGILCSFIIFRTDSLGMEEGDKWYTSAWSGIWSLVIGFQLSFIICGIFFTVLWGHISERETILETNNIGEIYMNEYDDLVYFDLDTNNVIQTVTIDDYVIIGGTDSVNVLIREFTTLSDTAYWGSNSKELEHTVLKLGIGNDIKKIKD